MDPDPRIPPGRAERAEHHVAPADTEPGDVDVPARESGERHLDDGKVAQQLLDVGRDELRVVRESHPVVGAADQHQGAHSEGAGRGLESSGQESVGDPGELPVAQLRTVLGNEAADQPGAGLAAEPHNQLLQVVQ